MVLLGALNHWIASCPFRALARVSTSSRKVQDRPCQLRLQPSAFLLPWMQSSRIANCPTCKPVQSARTGRQPYKNKSCPCMTSAVAATPTIRLMGRARHMQRPSRQLPGSAASRGHSPRPSAPPSGHHRNDTSLYALLKTRRLLIHRLWCWWIPVPLASPPTNQKSGRRPFPSRGPASWRGACLRRFRLAWRRLSP